MPKRRVKRHEVFQPPDQSYKIIPLTKGQNALVDTVDFDRINQWNWSASAYGNPTKFRAVRCVNDRIILMHHAVLELPGDTEIDHESGDGLDNRRKNLRLCTRQQNSFNKGRMSRNTSGYKGVSWDKRLSMWRAQIRTGGRSMSIGRHKTAEAAARAYDEAAKRLHGGFARLNS